MLRSALAGLAAGAVPAGARPSWILAGRGVASWATIDAEAWSGAKPAKAQNLGASCL